MHTFNVPTRYDLSEIEATYQNGTLTLQVQRSEAAMRRAIEVKPGTSNQQNQGKQTIDAGSAGDQKSGQTQASNQHNG